MSLRNLIPGELAKGFGFFQSKPATAFSPVAVTPDELGAAWHGGKLHRPLLVDLNGQPLRAARCRQRHDLRFRPPDRPCRADAASVGAGTIIGSGTVSNKEAGGPGRPAAEGGTGYACIAEQRTVETIRNGQPATPFLGFGDQRTDRDARGWRRQHLRRHRADRDAYFSNWDLT